MYFGYRRLYAAEPVFYDCTCTTISFSSDLVIVLMFAFIIAALIVFAVLLIYCLIERQIIITRKQDIYLDFLPFSFNGFRILQISDLHHRKFGKDQKRIIKRVIKIKPDAVFITGDLISRDMRDFSSVSRFCSQLSGIGNRLVQPTHFFAQAPVDFFRFTDGQVLPAHQLIDIDPVAFGGRNAAG